MARDMNYTPLSAIWPGYGYGAPTPNVVEPSTANSGLSVVPRTDAIEALVREYTGGSWDDLLDKLERKYDLVIAKKG